MQGSTDIRMNNSPLEDRNLRATRALSRRLGSLPEIFWRISWYVALLTERSDIIFSDLMIHEPLQEQADAGQAHAARRSKFDPCASFCNVSSFKASFKSAYIVNCDWNFAPTIFRILTYDSRWLFHMRDFRKGADALELLGCRTNREEP